MGQMQSCDPMLPMQIFPDWQVLFVLHWSTTEKVITGKIYISASSDNSIMINTIVTSSLYSIKLI